MQAGPGRYAAFAAIARVIVGGAAAILLLSSPLGAQKKIERRLPLGMEGALRVVNMVGSVVVHGWNKDTVLVRGTLGAGDSFFMGGGYTGAKMFVESANDRDPKPSRLEIWVPARVRLWVKTATANIDVSDVAGGLDLYVVSGTIDVSVTWDEVAEVQRIGREIVVSLRDSRRLLRFSCHSDSEAVRGALIAEHLAQSAQRATAESDNTSFHHAAL